MRLFYSSFFLIMIVSYELKASDVTNQQFVTNILEGLGFSPVCVASSLASCERFAKTDCYLHVLYLLPELKSLLQDVKCENKDLSTQSQLFNSLSNLEDTMADISSRFRYLNSTYIKDDFTNTTLVELQELKLGVENRLSNFDNLIMNEIKLIMEELKVIKNEEKKHVQELQQRSSDLENTTSIFDNIMKEEIKLLLQKFKSELAFKFNNTEQEQIILLRKEMASAMAEKNYGYFNSLNNFKVPSSFSIAKKHQSCAEVCTGLQTVYPYDGLEDKPIIVSCDHSSDGGGWTVIQNRDATVFQQDFNRPWSDYVKGFGDVKGEFWLGLENIHALTNSTQVELRIDLEDFDGEKRWVKYDSFKIGDASTKYVLNLGDYSGDAGDSLNYHNGMKFSTYDQDNDQWDENCAHESRGGWWYDNCERCNLNGYQHLGKYSAAYDEGIHWETFRGDDYSLKKARMKIRDISYN